MKIHQIERDSTSQVSMDVRDSDVTSNIHDAKVRQMIFSNGFINFLVFLNST